MIVKSYSKQELALLYFPDATPEQARHRLNGWLRRNPILREAFRSNKFSKFYTPRQVSLIIEYLGEP